jgi:pseudouridine kinase
MGRGLRCAVVGAANIDIGGFPNGRIALQDSNPGRVVVSAGGVGRNIACNLARLGIEAHLVAPLGTDAFAGIVRADCARAGVDTDLCFTFPDAASSTYLFIADINGDMQLAVNDMDICLRMTSGILAERVDALNGMDAVVLDANLPEETVG